VNDLPPSRAIVRFGVFELDTESAELRKQGVKIRLQEQPFQVLQILLEHPGRVVTRNELQRRIWPSDTFVDFDTGLYSVIKKLREALGDLAESPRFIETLSRRGYRFIAAVEGNGHAAVVPAPTLEGTKPATSRNLRLGVSAGLAVAIVIGVAFGGGKLWRRFSSGNSVPQIRSIAVLPLENLSSDPSQEYFSDGMTDALITELSHIDSVRVISRTSSMQYKQTRKSLSEISRELNVDGIVEGTVQRSGDRVRITAQLILGSADKHLWANSYERDNRDVFALEREVTGDIARQIRARLTPLSQVGVSSQPANLTALEAYLQGNYYLDRWGSGVGDDAKRKAEEYFQRAIDADPNFAPAYTGLAEAHWALLLPSKTDVKIVEESAERAAALDPTLSDAHWILGMFRGCAYEFQRSEEEYRRAIALNPNNAEAHDSLGGLLDGLGRSDEGWREHQTAQKLDPNHDHISDALMTRGRYDEAIAVVQMLLKLYPEDSFVHLAAFRDYAKKGMYEEALPHAEQVFVLVGLPEIADRMRRHAASGYRDALREAATALEHSITTKETFLPVSIAELYAVLGEKDRAFYWLEQAYAHHDVEMVAADLGLDNLNVDFLLDSLRSDPRFKDLVRRVGLPELQVDESGGGRRTTVISQ
jgi:TolB-like protein/DNA-binding winged helix-turn-helix (wHTH) protein/Tfp pilus assembly protein PilF